MKILIACPTPGIRVHLERRLTREKHLVRTATNGGEAMRKLHGANPLFELLILDHDLDGTAGIVTLRKARRSERLQEMRVIFISDDDSLAGKAGALNATFMPGRSYTIDSLIKLIGLVSK